MVHADELKVGARYKHWQTGQVLEVVRVDPIVYVVRQEGTYATGVGVDTTKRQPANPTNVFGAYRLVA